MTTTERPVIIEAAINGATRRTTQPAVPITPAEIAVDALACFNAGASIVHHHLEIGGGIKAEVAQYLDTWRIILGARPDALVYPTVHFGPPISYEHLAPLAESGLLRIGITDPGSVNLGRVDHRGVPTGSFVYANPFDAIGRSFELCNTHRLGTSMAIYEPGFLRTALAWRRAARRLGVLRWRTPADQRRVGRRGHRPLPSQRVGGRYHQPSRSPTRSADWRRTACSRSVFADSFRVSSTTLSEPTDGPRPDPQAHGRSSAT